MVLALSAAAAQSRGAHVGIITLRGTGEPLQTPAYGETGWSRGGEKGAYRRIPTPRAAAASSAFTSAFLLGLLTPPQSLQTYGGLKGEPVQRPMV